MEKKRLDLLLLELGLASTRTKAQDLIAGEQVSVEGVIVKKAGEKFPSNVKIELAGSEHPYVSRGGLKMEFALQEFQISVANKVALDVGLSTGGFTHCLLLHGAESVVGVDVGSAQVAPLLRADPRVTIFEGQDIRTFDPVKWSDKFDFFVADLSFISLTQVLESVSRFLKSEAEGILLVKPQFEVGRDKIGSGGIVRDAASREYAIEKVSASCKEIGFRVLGKIACPVMGADGNQEFLFHVRWPSQASRF